MLIRLADTWIMERERAAMGELLIAERMDPLARSD